MLSIRRNGRALQGGDSHAGFFFSETPMFKSFSLLLVFSLAACAAAAPGSARLDRIDGRQLETLTLRHVAPAPVVVFEGGSRGTIDKWGSVPELVAAHATVFAYNRPGYGRSSVADTVRDGATIVEELRSTLRQKGLAPPYVLVGHSLGGLYMQLFARRYPQEVSALVLIDSLYPGMIKQPQDFPWTTRVAGQLAFSRSVWREIEQIDTTGEVILGLPAIDDKPIVRLVNQPVSSTAIAVDFGAFRMDQVTRDAVRALYPKATKIVVDSSHQMALTSPEIVASAILRVLPVNGGNTVMRQ